jgi:hypothetical protein
VFNTFHAWTTFLLKDLLENNFMRVFVSEKSFQIVRALNTQHFEVQALIPEHISKSCKDLQIPFSVKCSYTYNECYGNLKCKIRQYNAVICFFIKFQIYFVTLVRSYALYIKLLKTFTRS